TGWSDVYYWSEEFDGPALTIYGVDNLVIRSESGDRTKCTISAVPRYADVLKFKSCNNVTVSGITAGHTVEPGYCTGGVLYYEDCDNVLVNRCGLYGCGILGVRAELCSAIAVTGCEIYECSYGGIQMGNTSGIQIENCSFRDLGGDALYFYECKDVTVDGEQVSGNARLSY
ncbi:MAG: right-handed parallel beta-helix repeat-containing protein, partial [Oscillospiraceae bacterium]|nr:right-handed parallel beta-helix repeat-containing protein [Oscillospiraceae bacterium]